MESQRAKQRRSIDGSEVGGASSSGREFQFQMPLHYPKYTKAEYETMPECRLDSLLQQYGLPLSGDLHQKRLFAIGAFIWPYSHFPSDDCLKPF